MKPRSLFEITRRDMDSSNASGTYAAAASRGIALGAGATPDTFALADGSNFIGFLTRDVVAGGASLTERLTSSMGLGRISATPVVPEWPFAVDGEVAVERAEEIEVEGSTYLVLSGTGTLASAAVGNKLSFISGKLRVAQTGEIVWGTVTAVYTADADMVDVANTLRIRAVAI